MESIFRPVMVLMTGRVLGFAAAFVVPIILARVLEQSEFGTYKQLFLIYSTLFSVAQLGMSESLFYFLPAAQRNGGQYASNAILVLIAAGGGCLLLLWQGQDQLSNWLNNPALADYVIFIGWFLLLKLASSPIEIVMTSRKQHKYASATYALSDLTRAILSICLVLWFGELKWLLYGVVIYALLRFVATIVYLKKEYGKGMRANVSLAKTQLAYAAPFSLYVLIEVMQLNLHQYAVSFKFDAATFAIYAVGCLSIPLVDFLSSSAGNVMMVRMREHLLDGNTKTILTIWGDITRKLVLIFAPLVGCLLITANEFIVWLFTDRYEESVPVFMVWSLMILFTSLLTDAVLRVYSEVRYLMMLGLFKLVIMSATINMFMDMFGLPGAVLTVVVTLAITKLIALFKIKSVMKCSFANFLPWGSLLSIIALAVVSSAPAIAVKSTLSSLNPFSILLVTALIYVGTYVSILWLLGPLSREEKSFVIEYLSKPGELLGKRS